MRNLLLLLMTASTANAQPARYAFPPPAAGITTQMDVQYGTAGTTRLAMDVYRPAGTSSTRLTALIFFNRAQGADRSAFMNGFYAQWARAAASKGLIGILPDLRDGSEAADFRTLIKCLEDRGAELGIGAIGVYAASGNVSAAFPVLEDPGMTTVKAAVIYYGTARVDTFRLDLPVLYVRAGLDRPPVNEAIAAIAARAVAQNAPLTLLNYAGGHHGFEALDDNDATRDVIDQTLEFVKQKTSPAYQTALRATLPEATAAGYVQAGKTKEAADAYAGMVAKTPDNHTLRLSYGEALLRDKQYASACAEFEKLRDKPIGPRDRGLPAAEACMLAGDLAKAVAWLGTIPARFLPAQTAQDPRWAALRDRDDFQALFKRIPHP
jgi:Dienelactone hydrolase family